MSFYEFDDQFLYLVYCRVKEDNGHWFSGFRVCVNPTFGIDHYVRNTVNGGLHCGGQVAIVGVLGTSMPYSRHIDITRDCRAYQHTLLHRGTSYADLYLGAEWVYDYFFKGDALRNPATPWVDCCKPIMTYREVIDLERQWMEAYP